MSYLLDTNICIAAMNGRPAGVADRIAVTIADGHVVAISTIAIFELQYGIAKSVHIEKNIRALEVFLRPLLILPFGGDDARRAAQMRAALEKSGKPIGPYDYLIAAQALSQDLVLVTANIKEFSRITGLRSENWIR